ncbi:MAG TPA: cytochrome-c peroxidase [Polyangiaceae bacterium]|nr:cytochrome-c peroxidase [Polyangiaceae bacterium]
MSRVALGVALAGCNSFDEAPGPETSQPRLAIPIDERAATSSIGTRPISGGTLSVTADGRTAIVADSERDQISIVDLVSLAPRHIALEPGDEPGRLVEDANRRVHVALRSGGAIATIDLNTAALVERRAVCKAPRGIAFDAAGSQLHVACAEGKLVSLPAAGGAVTRSLTLEPDLRDVLVRGAELWVTRFKSAEMLRIDSTGTIAGRTVIPPRQGTINQPMEGQADFGGLTSKSVTTQPHVAWKAVAAPSGGAVVVHQSAVIDEIAISPPSQSGSAYGGGGGFDCSGIVNNVVTRVNPDGTSTSTAIAGAPLPVDVAVSPDQSLIAVAHAGPADSEAPRPFLVFPEQDGDVSGGSAGGFRPGFGSSLSVVSLESLGFNGCAFNEGVQVIEAVTAVAFAPDGRLLAQTRQPAQLLVFKGAPFGTPVTIPLSSDSRLNTGHELFHRDSGGGIACASCHPEGGEDGQTWRFADTGERRTQALHVGLRDTAPFHWAGDLENVGELMSEVFVQRMGGVRQSSSRLQLLTDFLFSMEPPPPIRDAGDEAAVRGRALFDSAEVGCATCHSGTKLTNNQSVAVDSVAPQKLQVPSLVAIGYRAPFMHTGCATTLADRFRPDCGGNAHGNVSGLSADQLGDLVAYLESL